MPSIGELFVSLGIKGGDKTLGQLEKTQDGMGKIRDLSFEAKAAIAAAAYAIEKLFQASGQHGLQLSSLSTVLGTSTKALQEYEYAAKLAGVSNEQLAGTFLGLSKTSAQILRGEAKPLGLNAVMDALRKAGQPLTFTGPGNSLQNAAAHPEILLQALQKYAQIEKDVGLRNLNLESFGISDPNLLAALVNNKFNAKTFGQANILGGGEVKALNQNREKLEAIGDKLTVSMERELGKFGPEFLKDLDALVPKITALVDAFGEMVRKTSALQIMGKIFEGWGYIFEGITKAVKIIDDWTDKHPEFGSSVAKGAANALFPGAGMLLDKNAQDAAINSVSDAMDKANNLIENANRPQAPEPNSPKPYGIGLNPDADTVNHTLGPKIGPMLDKLDSMIPGANAASSLLNKIIKNPEPKVAPVVRPQASNAPVEVNQTLNFTHTGQDSQRTASDVKTAVRQAFRQLPSIGQGA